jgi:hypothetical protein
MPVTIEAEQLAAVKPTSNGVDIPLTKEQKETPLYYTFINTNGSLTDFFPAEPWRQQIGTDMPLASGRTRLRIEKDGEERGLHADDGIIVDIAGYRSGLYGWDNVGKRYLDEEESDQYEETSGTELGREERWTFYVERVRVTDGPFQRDLKFRTEEQKAEMAKENMFQSVGDAIALAFQQAGMNMQAAGTPNATPQEALASLDMDALRAELLRRENGEEEEISDEEAEARRLDATDFNAPVEGEEEEKEEEELIEATDGSSSIDEILARGTSA